MADHALAIGDAPSSLRFRQMWWAFLCRVKGHDWYECAPECCGQTLCWRCGRAAGEGDT